VVGWRLVRHSARPGVFGRPGNGSFEGGAVRALSRREKRRIAVLLIEPCRAVHDMRGKRRQGSLFGVDMRGFAGRPAGLAPRRADPRPQLDNSGAPGRE
jgi:hypothetical protein